MKKRKIEFVGDYTDDSLLIGSHGDTRMKVEGKFQLSGIIYCPKYSVTFEIKGDGNLTFRGSCNHIIIKKIDGSCTLDLREVTCKDIRCDSLGGRSIVITGRTRFITRAILKDEAVLHVTEKPLITNFYTSGNSKIIQLSTLETSVSQ